MKEIVGKVKIKQDSFPKRLVIDNRELTHGLLEIYILSRPWLTYKTEIAKILNEFFRNVGPSLPENILDENIN